MDGLPRIKFFQNTLHFLELLCKLVDFFGQLGWACPPPPASGMVAKRQISDLSFWDLVTTARIVVRKCCDVPPKQHPS